MATSYKVLGQVNPAATTATTAYTVPAATEAIVSSIVVANQAATAGTYRVAVRPDGDTLAAEHYLAYDISLPANTSDTLTLGVTMDATDVITVYASSTDFSFNIFGSEIA
jgi:glucose-6-phosphate dehydrogenase assembly protein OpcA